MELKNDSSFFSDGKQFLNVKESGTQYITACCHSVTKIFLHF